MRMSKTLKEAILKHDEMIRGVEEKLAAISRRHLREAFENWRLRRAKKARKNEN